MTTLDELHAAVLADLDADAPRLVLADALQAAGDPRGELIAVQCELARLGCRHLGIADDRDHDEPERDLLADALAADDRERIAALRRREHELLGAHRARWAEGVRGGHRFERGFVDHVPVYGVMSTADVFDAAPMLRSLELWAAEPRHLTDPRLAQLRHLGLSGDDAALQLFFEEVANRMPSLRGLQLRTKQPTIKQLSMMWGLGQLVQLGITGPYLGNLVRILETSKVSDLRISQGEREASLAFGRMLASSPAARQLETLVLDNCQLRADLAAIVRVCPKLAVLRVYEDGTDWLRDTLPALATVPGLRALDLTRTNLRDELPALLGSFPALRVLLLGYCGLEDRGIRALADSPIIRGLRVLDLRVNPVSSWTIAKALLESRHHPPLELLAISEALSPERARALRDKFPGLVIEVDS